MNRDDRIYLAALLDGEGWISACRRRRPLSAVGRHADFYVLTVGIVNTHEPVIRWAHSLLGVGSVITTHPERTRPLFRWQVQQAKAVEVLRLLRPHMRIKGGQADLAIELWRLIDAYKVSIAHVSNAGRRLPEAEHVRRGEIVGRLRVLNGRAS